MSARKPRSAGPALVAGGFGLLWLLALGGADLLDPSDFGWMLYGDWAQHLTGWLFFRQSAWELPLGSIPDLAAPAGTTVGYTDAIPWLAVACKLLSPLLPEPFTYIGLWLVACFVLQGVFGARLLASAGLDARAAALGGCIFATAPILSFRIAHDALCGHFLILAALELHFRTPAGARERRRVVTSAFLWTLLAAGIHPYLAVMVMVLCGAAIVRLWVGFGLSAARAFALCVALAAVPLGPFAMFGYLGTGVSTGAAGFGLYSSDVLALANSFGRARWLPDLGSAGGQYEGFGYLGAGVLALALVAALGAFRGGVRRAPGAWRRGVPLALAVAGFTVFSWSDRVTAAGVLLVDYSAWTVPLQPLLETFRASGRFVWVVHYTVVALACIGCARALRGRPRALAGLFALALGLQVFGQLGMPVWDRFPSGPVPAFSPVWQEARAEYRSVSLVPPVINVSGDDLCDAEGPKPDELTPYALLAHTLGKPFNSAQVARANEARARVACAVTLGQVAEDRLDPGILYLVAPAHLAAFRAAAPGARCGSIDGLHACVAKDARGRFAATLDRLAVPVPEAHGGAPAAVAAAALLGLAVARRNTRRR